jgi:hypothetical protein
MMLARLATKAAKPNGKFEITPHNMDRFISSLELRDLPGVGWSTRRLLEQKGIASVAHLRSQSKSDLMLWLGEASGQKLYECLQGLDERPLREISRPQTLGAEVNWGIRFESSQAAEIFLGELCSEVHRRLRENCALGNCITISIKKKKDGWVEPSKFLGHGRCFSLSKSRTFRSAIDIPKDLDDAVINLFREMCKEHQADYTQVVGVGINVSKLRYLRPNDVGLGQRNSRSLARQMTLGFGRLAGDTKMHASNGLKGGELEKEVALEGGCHGPSDTKDAGEDEEDAHDYYEVSNLGKRERGKERETESADRTDELTTSQEQFLNSIEDSNLKEEALAEILSHQREQKAPKAARQISLTRFAEQTGCVGSKSSGRRDVNAEENQGGNMTDPVDAFIRRYGRTGEGLGACRRYLARLEKEESSPTDDDLHFFTEYSAYLLHSGQSQRAIALHTSVKRTCEEAANNAYAFASQESEESWLNFEAKFSSFFSEKFREMYGAEPKL